MKIVFCASEVFPFAKTGGLADVCGTLPLALEKLGHEVSIFLPHYKNVRENHKNHHGPEARIDKDPSGRFSRVIVGKNINVYLVEHNGYYDRDKLYGDDSGDYSDNLERFQYFCDETLMLLKHLNMRVDIIHCHDWQTALIPVYLKHKYKKDPFFASTRVLLTLHNLAFQGIFPKTEYPKIGLPKELFNMNLFEFFGQINLLKAGIIDSHGVNTVSPQYAKEIQTKEFGCGLEGVLRFNRKKVIGILNGLDYDYWNPRKDPYLAQRFDVENYVEGKKANKIKLQKKFKLPSDPDVPLLGFVSRLSHQKGVDVILEALKTLLRKDVQMIISGVGDKKYLRDLNKAASEHPKQLAVFSDFDEAVAHQIYAASDIFLMPSRFEPCGLSQMISLRYGAVPVVYHTGGLADTIKDFSPSHTDGNGIVFKEYTAKAFIKSVEKALGFYKDYEILRKIHQNGFHSKFTWDNSAEEYQKEYECLLSA